MAFASSSVVDMEESEITRCDREGNERRAIFDNLAREFDLFNMENNVSRESEEEETEDVSLEESIAASTLILPGIKFFSQPANCDYDQNSIRAELSGFGHCSELDLQSLTDLKEKIMYEYIIENSTDNEHPFKIFMKLLFTSQSREYLKLTAEILILYLRKCSRVYSFVDIVIASFPIGLKNIGGNVSKLFSPEKLCDNSSCDVDKLAKVQNFIPVENIRNVVDVLNYSLRGAKLQLRGKFMLPDETVDDLIFTLLVVSQDPQILTSNVIPSIQNCLAEILDIYPSDVKYLNKVQDIVERILLYWEDFPEDFSHVVSYMLCVDVIPLSRRGKQLKTSLAYTSLNFCLPSAELNILDRVTLYQLSKFCRENLNEFFNLDCKTLYSVIRLIDAAIIRPVTVDNGSCDITFGNNHKDIFRKIEFIS